MKYNIVWIETKMTKVGKPYASAQLKGEDGIVHDKVAIWSNHPQFNGMVNGGMVEGEIEVGERGKNLKWTQTPQRQFTPKPTKTEANIEKNMDRKEESIKISGAQRDATLMVTTFYPQETDSIILKQRWQEWKSYFISQYDSAF